MPDYSPVLHWMNMELWIKSWEAIKIHKTMSIWLWWSEIRNSEISPTVSKTPRTMKRAHFHFQQITFFLSFGQQRSQISITLECEYSSVPFSPLSFIWLHLSPCNLSTPLNINDQSTTEASASSSAITCHFNYTPAWYWILLPLPSLPYSFIWLSLHPLLQILSRNSRLLHSPGPLLLPSLYLQYTRRPFWAIESVLTQRGNPLPH